MKLFLSLLLQLALFALPARAEEKALPREAKSRAVSSCFEVVILRPDPAKDPVSYEKELPWDMVPFNIRNDHYFSIGTAFAVSDHELVTAHHVFQATLASMGYTTCYIRDSQQKVYEVDQILAMDEQRDVVRFSVKGLRFSTWLPFRADFKLNETVFTVGNAYGEGVVVRPGEIIGTLPEPFKGAWDLLKSSADVSPGNSGGPLVDADGNVVGVVLGKRDNICYALPTAQVKAMKPSAAVFYNKITYSFSLFPDKTKALERAFEFPLPMPYAELRKDLAVRSAASYKQAMDGLFAGVAKDIFPMGEDSEEAIHEIPSSIDPEVIYRDNTTRKWSFSGLDYKSTDLGRNGRLKYANANGVYFFNIHRPDNVQLGDLLAHPKVSMDLILKGVSVTRTVGNQEIRVTSFGEPYQLQQRTDRFGRPWQEAIWFTAYDDGVVLTYSTLVPSGLVMAAKFVDSSQLMEWQYDLPRILDYTYVPYFGHLSDWSEYLKHRKELPALFQNIAFDLREDRSLKVKALWAALDLDGGEIELSPRTSLGLFMGFSKQGDDVVWDLRKASLEEDEDDNYFVLLKHLHPAPVLDDSAQNEWKEVAKQKHPYTQRSFEEKGTTRIAALLPSFIDPAAPSLENKTLITLYLARTGKVEEGEMQDRLKKLIQSVRPAPAVSPTVKVRFTPPSESKAAN
ncbi:MAG TPA: serine protease [Holophagaceae bacterium]|nr:serine protease [Holophagaceae bacterium]